MLIVVVISEIFIEFYVFFTKIFTYNFSRQIFVAYILFFFFFFRNDMYHKKCLQYYYSQNFTVHLDHVLIRFSKIVKIKI